MMILCPMCIGLIMWVRIAVMIPVLIIHLFASVMIELPELWVVVIMTICVVVSCLIMIYVLDIVWDKSLTLLTLIDTWIRRDWDKYQE